VFFVLYMIVGSLFVMNLFVGVVIDNFNKIKDKEENGGGFMTFQ
jgi:Na+/glutamate symporter